MTPAGYHPLYDDPRCDGSLIRGSLAISGVFAALAVFATAVSAPDPESHAARISAQRAPDRDSGRGTVNAATCTHVVTDLENLSTALLTATEGEVLCLRGPDRAPAATSAVAFARAALGTPYVWGGNGKQDGGFDCSGLTTAAYASAGLGLPRTAQRQYDTLSHLPSWMPPQPGDLIFFGAGPRSVTHVGIAISDTLMINAPRRGDVVKIAPLRRADLVGIARPSDPAAVTVS